MCPRGHMIGRFFRVKKSWLRVKDELIIKG
jgi:hypothetical protein